MVPHVSRGARMMWLALGAVQSGGVAGMITAAANTYGVDPGLAVAVGQQESNLNPNVPNSSAGAIGVMQLMPGTAASLGVDPYDTAENIEGGVMYLAQLLSQFGGDVSKAVAAYNAGPGAVTAAVNANGGDWLSALPQETQNYVAAITGVTPGSNASAGTYLIDADTGFLVPDTGDGDEAAASDGADLSLVEIGLLTALGVGAYLFFRETSQ